jgi:ferredoxin
MRVRVDLDRCQGYGNCVGASPSVFDLADNGLVLLLDENPPAEKADEVRQAVQLCPVQAIAVEDE